MLISWFKKLKEKAKYISDWNKILKLTCRYKHLYNQKLFCKKIIDDVYAFTDNSCDLYLGVQKDHWKCTIGVNKTWLWSSGGDFDVVYWAIYDLGYFHLPDDLPSNLKLETSKELIKNYEAIKMFLEGELNAKYINGGIK